MKHLMFIFILMFIATIANAQSLIKGPEGVTVQYDLENYDKAVKTSASLIPSKKGHKWIAEGVVWETTFTNNIYSLKKGNVEVYSSTTIAAVRAKYLSVLLGIPMKIPS